MTPLPFIRSKTNVGSPSFFPSFFLPRHRCHGSASVIFAKIAPFRFGIFEIPLEIPELFSLRSVAASVTQP